MLLCYKLVLQKIEWASEVFFWRHRLARAVRWNFLKVSNDANCGEILLTSRAGLPGFRHVDHIGLTVPDLDAAIAFYEKVFGAEILHRLGPISADDLPLMPSGLDWMQAHLDVKGARLEKALMKLGHSIMIELFQYDEPGDARKSPPRNCDIGAHHVAYCVEKLEPAIAYLVSQGCRPMEGLFDMDEGPTANERSQYLSDPWGNYLELMEYSGK